MLNNFFPGNYSTISIHDHIFEKVSYGIMSTSLPEQDHLSQNYFLELALKAKGLSSLCQLIPLLGH